MVGDSAGNGRVVLVTGAGSGLGAAIARRFAGGGARVLVTDVDGGAAEHVAAGLSDAIALEVDVTSSAQVEAAVQVAEQRFGGLDVLIANAGLTHRLGPVEDLPESEFDRVVGINVKGVFLCAKYAIPALRRRGRGVIVNTASIAAVAPRAGLAVYNASKGAVATMTRSLAVELAPMIRVNAVMPVAADTNFMLGSFDGGLTDTTRDALVGTIPMGRLCEPEDVAAAVEYLASDDAAFLTGVCLPVDGGRSI
jgi:3-oxoacyl-[acyl-carrier protein] reductase